MPRDCCPTGNEAGGRRHRQAFTLLEMLVAAGILVVIMLGLLAMFYQTDRALRLSFQQRDILDAGRSAMEIIVRDLSMATAAGVRQTNLNDANLVVYANYAGLLQPLNEGSPVEIRTNTIQQFFFLTRLDNDLWNGIRYDFSEKNGVATLFRMEHHQMLNELDCSLGLSLTTPYAELVSSNLFYADYFTATNSHDCNFRYGRIAEGVVHLTLKCYDTYGYLISEASTELPELEVQRFEDVYSYVFKGTNMPAFVEVEFGVLDPKVFRIARDMNDAQAAANYLADQAGAVQIFRERIPIRYRPPATTLTGAL